jgi:hypothetical protein
VICGKLYKIKFVVGAIYFNDICFPAVILEQDIRFALNGERHIEKYFTMDALNFLQDLKVLKYSKNNQGDIDVEKDVNTTFMYELLLSFMV